ncbi:MAG: nitroreductase family protein [Anaerolineaceae bacterium]|nr:nitroreductase family protein [Anaerolineaceae bacterium]
MNKQPWEFVVVDDPEMLAKIRQDMTYGRQETPLAILVCVNEEKARNDLNIDSFWIQDCSAVTENILIAVSSLGLGAVWLGVFPVDDFIIALSKTLQLPDHVIPFSLLYIGYPDEQKDAHTKYTEEAVFWQQYGNRYSK